jgi:uncharacterized repeat protein (TIGR03943 family)
VSREGQGGVMLIVGLVVTRLVLAGGHASYVRPSFGLLLLPAAVVVAGLGLVTIWKRPGASHNLHAERIPRVGWLVLVPMLTLVAVAPAPLGAYAAGVKGSFQSVARPSANFPPLPTPEGGAVSLQLRDFVGRAVYDRDSIEGVRVRLVGLVTPDATAPSGYLLTRFVVGCCAADAAPVQVAVVDDAVPRSPDAWLEVTGTFRPRPAGEGDVFVESVPFLVADGVRSVGQPAEPYEF